MELILNAAGQPFSDKTAAGIKARTLTVELGEAYAVVDHPDGGFAVAKKNGEAVSLGHARPYISASEDPTVHAAPLFQTMHLHPAWRSFWERHLLLLAGATAAFAPRFLLSAVLTGILNADPVYIERIASWGILPYFSLIGVVAMVVALANMLYGYYANNYQIGPNTIETCFGIISRKIQRIEYRHIRSVNVNQGFIGRLLNFGLVEISTAATEGGDLNFHGVANPTKIQEEIYRRKQALSRRHGEAEEDE